MAWETGAQGKLPAARPTAQVTAPGRGGENPAALPRGRQRRTDRAPRGSGRRREARLLPPPGGVPYSAPCCVPRPRFQHLTRHASAGTKGTGHVLTRLEETRPVGNLPNNGFRNRADKRMTNVFYSTNGLSGSFPIF